MNTFPPSSQYRSPGRRRLLAAGAAVVVAGLGIATWAGVSAAGTRSASHSITPSTIAPHPNHGGSVSPAVPSRPTVNPAVPSRPSTVPTANPAVPSKPSSVPAVNPAVPSKPSSVPAVHDALTATPLVGARAIPSLTGSVRVLKSYSKGELSIQMTVVNSTDRPHSEQPRWVLHRGCARVCGGPAAAPAATSSIAQAVTPAPTVFTPPSLGPPTLTWYGNDNSWPHWDSRPIRNRKLADGGVANAKLDDVPDPVRGGKLLRQDGNRRPLHRVDPPSARPRREHAQDSASRPDVENDVAGAHHRLDRTPEGVGPNPIADHRPVHLELGIHRVRRVPDGRPHVHIVGVAWASRRRPVNGDPCGIGGESELRERQSRALRGRPSHI